MKKTFSEVHTNVDGEAPVAGGVELVLTDVGQTDIVTGIKIEHIESYAATYLESAVKAAVVVVVKGTLDDSRVVVLDVAVGSQS